MKENNEVKTIVVVLIAIWFIAFGIGLCHLAGLFNVRSFDDLYQLFYDKGFAIIAALFFIIIAIYIIITLLKKDKKSKKTSYWLNLYTPVYKFEDVFVLPIVYAITIPMWLSIIMAPIDMKYIGIIISIVPTLLIIYDLVYKIKKGK